MGNRGRASVESQAIVVAGNFGQRPEPPEELTADQAEIWRSVVASEAADFFRTAALRGLLKDYCRHTVTAAAISKQINAFEAAWLSDAEALQHFDRMTKIRDRETKAAAEKATKLRLTNQSRYTPQAAATAAKHANTQKKPWEIGA